MSESKPSCVHDPCSDERIAAEVRQVFRAVAADDAAAVDICWFHFQNLLVHLLNQKLKTDPRWDPNQSLRENSYDGWWLDLLVGTPAKIQPPVWLHIKDDVYWYNDANLADPASFEFEMELCPATGRLRCYSLHFGNPQLFAPAIKVGDGNANPKWAFSFVGGSGVQSFEDPPKDYLILQPKGVAFGEFENSPGDSEVWLAALTRQFFRAREDNDLDAGNVSLIYLRHCLLTTLQRALRGKTQWGHTERERTVTSLSVTPVEDVAHNILRLRGDAQVQVSGEPAPDQDSSEPIDVQIHLCPRTGAFVNSTIRFGTRNQNNLREDSEWAFVFARPKQ